MKLTESQLKQVIAEEIQQMVDEGFFTRMKGRAKGFGKSIKGKAKAAAVGAMGKAAGWADEEAGEKLAKRSADLKKGAETARSAARLGTVVDGSLQELITDLEKMGISPTGDVEQAIKLLKQAVAAAAKQAG